MANQQHIEWLKEGVAAWNARRERDDFIPDFEGADLTGIDLAPLQFRHGVLWKSISFPVNYQLKGVNLYGALLSGANLAQQDLRYSDLRYADLKFADLRHTDFQSARLQGANLEGSLLSSARLNTAFLQGASLIQAELIGTDLNGAHLDRTDLRGTDLRHTKYLRQNRINSAAGDFTTLLPSRLNIPIYWEIDELEILEELADSGQQDQIETALQTPLIRASAIEVNFEETGIEARVPTTHAVYPEILGPDCKNRVLALIENCTDTASNVSNRLGENTQQDLISYAEHLKTQDPANPHRLQFLARSIASDVVDPLVAEGFSNRLKFQLSDFQRLHLEFLQSCVPDAAEAIRIKDEAALTRVVSKLEATEILDRLEAAILSTDAAAASMQKVLSDLRGFDDELNKFEMRVFGEAERAAQDKRIEAETKELASFGGRLYFRAKEVVAKARQPLGDAAIVATLSGQTVFDVAQKIVTALAPLITKLGQLLTMLPPA